MSRAVKVVSKAGMKEMGSLRRGARGVLIATMLLATACGGNQSERLDLPRVDSKPPAPVSSKPSVPRALLRIRNVGAHPIQQLIVAFPDERLQFDHIDAGEATEYREVVHGVYGGAAMGYVLNGKKTAPFAIDGNFGKPLSGRFTYDVDVQRHLHNEYVRLVEVVRDSHLLAAPIEKVTQ